MQFKYVRDDQYNQLQPASLDLYPAEKFFDGAVGTWSCNEDGEAEPSQNMKLIFVMRS